MTALLDVRALVRVFEPRESGEVSTCRAVRAVDGVDLAVAEGESVGVCGESGSGKTTLVRLIAGLLRPTSGTIAFRSRAAGDHGEGAAVDLGRLSERAWRPLRREIQIVFQNADASLNPRRTVGASVADPLRMQRLATRRARPARVVDLLASVGLAADIARRLPSDLSAGQRQRAVLARALAPGPRLLLCDEPVSALDPSTQAEILGLLADLRVSRALSILLVAHDLAVLRNLTDRVAVLYRGRWVELARTDELFLRPRHPYTERLMSVIPRLDQVPSPSIGTVDATLDLASERGCRYRGACRFADAGCAEEAPRWREIGRDRLVACRRAEELVLSSPLA